MYVCVVLSVLFYIYMQQLVVSYVVCTVYSLSCILAAAVAHPVGRAAGELTQQWGDLMPACDNACSTHIRFLQQDTLLCIYSCMYIYV